MFAKCIVLSEQERDFAETFCCLNKLAETFYRTMSYNGVNVYVTYQHNVGSVKVT